MGSRQSILAPAPALGLQGGGGGTGRGHPHGIRGTRHPAHFFPNTRASFEGRSATPSSFRNSPPGSCSDAGVFRTGVLPPARDPPRAPPRRSGLRGRRRVPARRYLLLPGQNRAVLSGRKEPPPGTRTRKDCYFSNTGERMLSRRSWDARESRKVKTPSSLFTNSLAAATATV